MLVFVLVIAKVIDEARAESVTSRTGQCTGGMECRVCMFAPIVIGACGCFYIGRFESKAQRCIDSRGPSQL